ncbi:7TM diverse intracellular signaling domain-containing protein [Flammeovirga kamogawensis]|uniref:Transposase n=1 Tax=Flammeovirga kamogawensis TaxID=373891 RepID=A0ABX8H492_9BACT|nr:7TM diverse intracellular signaling domain-containing protein [Flammeovirga kamogawensis]MBB6461807.1 DNA-directed RNA polymerase subunit RPC12/RpoP [Flammeovirga kamogawensis]QWG10723.1 transposase [Flammeovirga kamogawensis]TRX63825.1 hypothetical protein EO216_25770 [Flammeovirga kamogawensis]
MLFRILLFTLLFFSINVNGKTHLLDTVFLNTTNIDQIIEKQSIGIFEDNSNSFSLNEILSLHNPFNVYAEDDHFYIIQDTAQTYWVKMAFSGERLYQGHLLLEVLDSHIDYFEAYQQIDNNEINAVARGGYDIEFNKRLYSHKNIVVPLPPVNKNSSLTIYLKYKTRFKNIFLYKVKDDKSFIRYANGEYILLGGFYGMLFLLAIYNLMLFVTLKERYPIYLSFFVISSMLVGLSEDNLGFQYIWGDTPYVNYVIKQITPALFMTSVVLFTSSFLKIRRDNRKVYVVIWISVLINIGYLILFGDFNHFLWQAPTYLIPFLIVFGYMLYLIKTKKFKQNYFISGYSTIVLGVIFLVLRGYGLYLDSIIYVYAFNIGLIINVFLMTLGLVQSFKMYKDEKDAAQQKIISNLKEREKIIETKVIDRTQEVENQKQIIFRKNEELEVVNKMLTDHRRTIEKMNTKLTIENEQLHDDVSELSNARVLLKEVSFEEFEELFPDDISCYKYLAKIKWNDVFACKKCGSNNYSNGQGHEARRCKKCSYNESATNGTLFHRLHFPIRNAFLLLFIVYANKGNIPSSKLAEMLNMRPNTCWKFYNKVKEAMKMKCEELGSEDELLKRGWEELIFIYQQS